MACRCETCTISCDLALGSPECAHGISDGVTGSAGGGGRLIRVGVAPIGPRSIFGACMGCGGVSAACRSNLMSQCRLVELAAGSRLGARKNELDGDANAVSRKACRRVVELSENCALEGRYSSTSYFLWRSRGEALRHWLSAAHRPAPRHCAEPVTCRVRISQ